MSLQNIKTFFLLICLIAVSCKPQKHNSNHSEVNIDGALMAIELAETIRKGQPIDSAQWKTLFDTEGYKSYLCSGNEAFRKSMIIDAFHSAFDPANQAQLDSILAVPVEFNKNAQRNLLIQNFAKWNGNFEEVNEFVRSTNFEQALVKANELTKTFLPKDAEALQIELFPVQLIAMDPDAYVNGCGLVMDLHIAANMGEEEFIKTIAHEYHHNYRQRTAVSYLEPAMLELDRLHREGIADLIDKEEPPLKEMMGSQALVKYYNEAYSNTPDLLKEFDSLTVAYLENKLDPISYSDKISGFFSFGGHPNGYYMAILVKEIHGLQPLIDSYSDPAAFLLLYNETASQIDGEYKFSKEFIEFVTEQQKIAEQQTRFSDEVYKVNFRVKAPKNTDAVFITGNQSVLGEWDPGRVELKRQKDGLYEVKLSLKSPAEFKFTRGSWDTEGFVKGQLRGPNTRLGFANDTLVSYEIEAWNDFQAN